MVLNSESSTIVAVGAHKLLIDVLYGLQKDAGKVLIVTLLGSVIPSLSKLPVRASTVVLGVLALVASLLGTLLVGGDGSVSRGSGAALLSALVLLAAALVQHLRPRPQITNAEVLPRLPAWRAAMAWPALPASAVAVGVPVWLVSEAARHRRRRTEQEEAARRELTSLRRDLQRALTVLQGLRERDSEPS